MLTHQIVHHLFAEGGYEQHCEKLQKKLAVRGKALLSKARARGWQAAWTGAGTYLWMSPGEGAHVGAAWRALAEEGVMVANESVFTSDRVEAHVRLNIAWTDDALLDRIAAAIAKVEANPLPAAGT